MFQMFFGMVRQSCGADDHPSANQFLYVYRLLSVNSLIKPPRRANVVSDPVAIFQTMKSIKHEPLSFVSAIEEHIDDVMLHDEPFANVFVCSLDCDHCYVQSSPMQCIMYYLSGYVAHKLRRFTTCIDCIAGLTGKEPGKDAKLIDIKTCGGLQIPSARLSHLIAFVECSVQKHSSKPHTYMYNNILNDVLWDDSLSAHTVGCEKHCTSLTARCIHFYIATRLHFLKKSVNRNRASRQTKQKLSKVSKLT